jgi:hypothetical protein
MLREAQIPLLLWISAAAMVHLAGGESAAKVAQVVNERRDIVAFSRAVRTAFRPTPTTIEIEAAAEPAKEEESPAEESASAPPTQAELLAKPSTTLTPPAPPPELPPLVEQPPKAEPEPPKPADKPPEAAAKAQPQELTLPKLDGRLAVQQRVNKGQEDNPTAPRIADDANKTDEETMARIRAYDQDSPNPSPGQPTPGKEKEPGNSQEDRTGFANPSEEPGDPRPGAKEGSDKPAPPGAPREVAPVAPPGRPAAQPASPGQTGRAAVPGQEGKAGGSGPGAPGAAGASGEYSIDPSGGDDRPRARPQQARSGVAGVAGIPGTLGFGLPGPYNLSLPGLVDAIGSEQLERERERAHAARMSKHRGSFAGADFEQYRAAIENYDPSVKTGSQTSLNAARVPFAGYINAMHNRIHPIFADGFLRSLDSLARDDKLNQKLVAHLEIVLEKQEGRVVRRGITKPSGVTAFDVAALKSLDQAAPFGKPPDVILSPDGRVYLHWEFHRDPYYACTSRFARPFLLKATPKPEPLLPKIEPPPTPPSADERYGSRKAPKARPK